MTDDDDEPIHTSTRVSPAEEGNALRSSDADVDADPDADPIFVTRIPPEAARST